MQKKIMANEATIKTATVEIKAITIGAKQMTLAVFRQLEQEDIIERRTGEISGMPWGRVNYCSKDCTTFGEHMHVLWQKENELRHATVLRKPAATVVQALDRRLSADAGNLFVRCLLDGVGDPRMDHDANLKLSLDEEIVLSRASLPGGTDYLIRFADQPDGRAKVWEDRTPSPPYPWKPMLPRLDAGETWNRMNQTWRHPQSPWVIKVAIEDDRVSLEGNAPGEEIANLRAREGDILEYFKWAPGVDSKNRSTLEGILSERAEVVDLYALRQRYRQSSASLKEYRSRWEASWNTLAALDQLFIAV